MAARKSKKVLLQRMPADDTELDEDGGSGNDESFASLDKSKTSWRRFEKLVLGKEKLTIR